MRCHRLIALGGFAEFARLLFVRAEEMKALRLALGIDIFLPALTFIGGFKTPRIPVRFFTVVGYVRAFDAIPVHMPMCDV